MTKQIQTRYRNRRLPDTHVWLLMKPLIDLLAGDDETVCGKNGKYALFKHFGPVT